MGVKASAATLDISLNFSQGTRNNLSHGPAMPLLTMHPKDFISYDRNTYTSMFIVALLSITRKLN